ncbi:MAG: hypothetical protein HUJ26_19715 [Planctomycetaceae bacterium]|nr:hypothetical protein [Planctomycetaceae bacterium]
MEATTLRRVEWRQLFPWLYLFGAFRIAIDPRKLLLAVLGLCFVAGGNHAIDAIGLRSGIIREASPVPRHDYPWSEEYQPTTRLGIEPLSMLTDPSAMRELFGNWNSLIDPILRGALHPALTLANSYQSGFAPSVDALLRLLWFAFVWGIFGGAITRMAVHQFVKDEKLSVVGGLKFSCPKVAQFLSAPLLPLGGTLVLMLMSAAIGLLGRIPGMGPLIMSVLIGFSQIFSVIIVILLIGVGAGWPLMVAAISTEDSDGFDGFSRAHSYIFDVPWHYLWCFVLAMMYASATVFFVDLLAQWVYFISQNGLMWGAGEGVDITDYRVASAVGEFWIGVLQSLVVGYRASLFWVLFLLIYLVLRASSDRIPMNEAYLEPLGNAGDEGMALGGLAAYQEEVTERPIVNPDDETDTDSENDSSSANPEEGDVSDPGEST